MRLSASYRHFWAKGKYYQRFWMSSGDSSIPGQTLTATTSLIAGQQQADASIAGQTLTDTLSLIAGSSSAGVGNAGAALTATTSLTSGLATGGTGANAVGGTITAATTIVGGDLSLGATVDGYLFDTSITLNAGHFGNDAAAPLNTRLNARYRHFWGRKRSERHFWAQYEGAGIGTTLADGQLIVSSLALLEAGQVHADANINGQTLTVDLQLDQGPTSIIEPGQMTVISAVIAEGIATADANLSGQTLTINPVLVQGWARFDTITVGLSIVGGTVFVPPDALAIPETTDPIVVSLFPGVTISDAAVVGADQEVVVELIAGQASAHVDSEGATLLVDVTLDQAQSSGDAEPSGTQHNVFITIEAGVATGDSGGEAPPMSGRVAGPANFYTKVKSVSIDAQAFGADFTVGYGIVSGKATGDHVAAFPEPSPSSTHTMPVDVQVLPESITKLLEAGEFVVPAEVVAEHGPALIQAINNESVPAVDWIAYDNALLELL